MIKIAIYGKGGIGKSTICSNLSAAFSEQGLKVMQIGCDPKADSTMNLCGGSRIPTVLDLVRTNKNPAPDECVRIGKHGIYCVEAGGPLPGQGCAGRGIINALEKLEQNGAFALYQPDVILYDVLGDVVCGGFTMPMRDGYADQVYIVTSGENMAVYAAANIAMAVKRFADRGYASLGGFIQNSRNIKGEDAKTDQLAADFDSRVVARLPKSDLVPSCEELHCTVIERYPDSEIACGYRRLARKILESARAEKEKKQKNKEETGDPYDPDFE